MSRIREIWNGAAPARIVTNRRPLMESFGVRAAHRVVHVEMRFVGNPIARGGKGARNSTCKDTDVESELRFSRSAVVYNSALAP